MNLFPLYHNEMYLPHHRHNLVFKGLPSIEERLEILRIKLFADIDKACEYALNPILQYQAELDSIKQKCLNELGIHESRVGDPYDGSRIDKRHTDEF